MPSFLFFSKALPRTCGIQLDRITENLFVETPTSIQLFWQKVESSITIPVNFYFSNHLWSSVYEFINHPMSKRFVARSNQILWKPQATVYKCRGHVQWKIILCDFTLWWFLFAIFNKSLVQIFLIFSHVAVYYFLVFLRDIIQHINRGDKKN